MIRVARLYTFDMNAVFFKKRRRKNRCFDCCQFFDIFNDQVNKIFTKTETIVALLDSGDLLITFYWWGT